MTHQDEIDAIRARQAYGIHRASDYMRESELTRKWWHSIRDGLLILAGVAMTIAPFFPLIKGLIQ